jgi:copper chaperone NosL
MMNMTMNEFNRTNRSFSNRGLMCGLLLVMQIGFTSCGPPEEKPVDIYSEDKCSYCGMPIGQAIFAGELITEKEVLKFDDLSCMDNFKTKHREVPVRASFVIDYRSKNWIRFERATIVPTGIATPMGSGLVAFADTASANAFVQAHPSARAF